MPLWPHESKSGCLPGGDEALGIDPAPDAASAQAIRSGWAGSEGFGVAWHAQVTPDNVQKAMPLNDQNDKGVQAGGGGTAGVGLAAARSDRRGMDSRLDVLRADIRLGRLDLSAASSEFSAIMTAYASELPVAAREHG